MDQDEATGRSGIQVIARAASILRALEAEPDGLTLSELSQRLGLARSTVQRIVGALVEEQMLISAGPRAGIMLGPALVRLASSANIETDKIARPVMQELSRSLGETVDLSVLQGRTAVFVEQIVGTSRLVAISAVGQAFPLHSTANGKALLACQTPTRRQALLSGKLRATTKATITDRANIEREIEEVVATQLAFDRGEHTEDICAVGVGFIDPLGRAFAISVPVPAFRFDKAKEIGRRLLEARAEILNLIPGCRIPT